MSDDPDPTDDAPDAEALAMDDVEADADFLEGRDPGEYPSVLRVTVEPEAKHREETLDRLQRWEAGEDVPHVINFERPSDLRALLTDRRVELLRAIMTHAPESIRGLADHVERDVKSVHEDLQVLAEYDVVHFEAEGRSKRPVVPYDTIEVSLEISRPETSDDVAPA